MTTPARDRKDTAAKLGIKLQAEYRAMIDATGENEISNAAIQLGITFNSNIEFICWVLKEFGGVDQMPLARARKAELPKTPAILLN